MISTSSGQTKVYQRSTSMSKDPQVITTRTLQKLKPRSKPYFIRSSYGFGIKVNPSGSIKFIVEAKVHGKSFRKTIGAFPQMPLKDAKATALTYIHKEPHQSELLKELLKQYLCNSRLKPSTVKDYSTVIPIYLADWMDSMSNLCGQYCSG
jgi:hypothetical protein